MKEISQFKSRKEWEEFIWMKFLESLEKNKSKKQIGEFLNSLLSTDERKMIIKRLVAISLIGGGKTYKEIGEILWISPTTISAIKKSLNNNLGYRSDWELNQKRRVSQRIERIRRLKIPQKGLFDYWLNFPWPTMVGKGRWKFLNYQG